MLRRLAGPYFGGAVAALVVSLGLCLCLRARLHTVIDVNLGALVPATPSFAWLAPRLLEGSLFALLLPLARRRAASTLGAALLVSAAPSALSLFWRLPGAGHGMLGVKLGALTPVLIVAANALWAVLLARFAGRPGDGGAQ